MIHPEVYNTVSLEFSALARLEASKSDRKLFSLGLGEPFWSVPLEARVKLSDLAVESHYGYSSPLGNQELRTYVAREIEQVSGYKIESSNVLITAVLNKR